METAPRALEDAVALAALHVGERRFLEGRLAELGAEAAEGRAAG